MPEERRDRERRESSLGSDRTQGVSVVGAPVSEAPTRRSSEGPRGRGRARSRSAARRRDEAVEAALALEEPEAETEPELGEPGSEDASGRALRRGGSRGGGARRRSGVLPVGAEVALIVLAMVGLATGIGFGLAWSNLNSQNSQRQAVANAARTFVLDVTSFKPTTVDADFAQVQNWAANGSLFAKQAAQFYNSDIRQSLVSVQGVSQGQIRDLYVETLGGSKAEVYAVVDQAYQNSKMSSPATDTLRMTLDMVSTSQGWRISAVTVENPSSGGTNANPSTSTGTPGS